MPTTAGGKLILAGNDSLSLIKVDNNNQTVPKTGTILLLR